MKVVILTQYYPPESVPIPRAVAQTLDAAGHRVRVVTGFPNYPEGKLFPGYRQQWRKLERDGSVEVLRVPHWLDHSQRPIRRMLNYISFALSSATTRTFTRDADVIYVYATQMTPALGPWIWSILHSTPYVLHIQDVWPDSILGSSLVGKGLAARFINRLLTPWLESVYKHASAVIGIGPSMVETLVARGVARSKSHLVYNWAPEAEDPSPARDVVASAGRHTTRILYAGNIGDMQDLETMVHAAHRAADAGIELVLVGDGVALPKTRELAAELEAQNIRFMGRIDASEMGTIYDQADYALVPLKDLPVFRGTVPSKFQAALSSGVPIITTVQGDVQNLVNELGVGLTAEPENISSAERAFRHAAGLSDHERAEMSRRATAAYESRFSLSAGTGAIRRILESAADSKGKDAHR